ncbi:MAG: polyprenyl synthetase family protein [Candidatus Bathyarchaeia archaeon]
MSLNNVLTQYSFLIEKKLKKELNALIAESYPFIKELYLSLKDFILRRGKRIASCTTLIVYKGYKNEVNEEILNACVGIELYRHSILIHDDLIDEDESRRGGKTIHQLFSEKRDKRFGDGEALLLGNITYALALNKVLNTGFKIESGVKAASLLSKAYKDVNESQALDLLFEEKEPKIDEWYIMASKRAASLFKASILTGAIFGEASEKDLKLLEEASINIGYAFDIQDDIIDLYASKEAYGKTPGRDLILKKKPLHIIYALSMANNEEVEKIKESFKKRSLSLNDIFYVKTIVEKSGALKEAKNRLKFHAEKAEAIIQKTSLNQEANDTLKDIINYISKSLEWYI